MIKGTPPWAREFVHYTRVALDDFELPIPPWDIGKSSALWNFRCDYFWCKYTAVYGATRCRMHAPARNDMVRKRFAILAKMIIEYSNFRLADFLRELEDDSVWSKVNYIQLTPRLMALLDEVMRMLPLAHDYQVKVGRILKSTEEGVEFFDELMGGAEIVVEYYISKIKPKNFMNLDILADLETVIRWACDYTEVFASARKW